MRTKHSATTTLAALYIKNCVLTEKYFQIKFFQYFMLYNVVVLVFSFYQPLAKYIAIIKISRSMSNSLSYHEHMREVVSQGFLVDLVSALKNQIYNFQIIPLFKHNSRIWAGARTGPIKLIEPGQKLSFCLLSTDYLLFR